MRQLGNAVPAQLSEAMGAWIASTLREDDGARVAVA
jgi:site-specific DNA-cytosine methylase